MGLQLDIFVALKIYFSVESYSPKMLSFLPVLLILM